MTPTVYALLLLAAFALFCAGTWWDVCRQCDKAQHEVELDALWDSDDDEFEAAA